MKIKALLLAAGLGTRLRPLTLKTPKCLVEIDGTPLLGIWLKKLNRLGCDEVLINTHYLNKEVENLDTKDLEKNYSNILILMFPILPHLVSECLEDVKKEKVISWPLAQKEFLEEKYVNIVIQINGKKKSLIKIEKNLDDKVLLENVKKDTKISNFLENKSIFKHIIVKNKLINFIVK